MTEYKGHESGRWYTTHSNSRELPKGSKAFEVWSEGYTATGENSGPTLHGIGYGRTSSEAITDLIAQGAFSDLSLITYNQEGEPFRYWGCRFFTKRITIEREQEKQMRRRFRDLPPADYKEEQLFIEENPTPWPKLLYIPNETVIVNAFWQMYYHMELENLSGIDGNDHPRLKALAQNFISRLTSEIEEGHSDV